MKTSNNRLILILMLMLLMLSQLMCGFPSVTISLPEEVKDQLSELEGIEYGVDTTTLTESNCENYFPQINAVESYKIEDNNLIVMVNSEEIVYRWRGNGLFCREPMPNVQECISELNKDGYKISVEEERKSQQNRLCYSANKTFTIMGELPVTEEINEQPQIEPDPDPEPEYSSPSECNAIGLINSTLSSPVTTTSASNETTCEYTLFVNNTGQEDIVVFKHIYQVFYTGENNSHWEDYIKLSPGESYSWDCSIETRNDNDTFTFLFIDAIAVIYDNEGCMNSFKDNTDAKEQIRFDLPLECVLP